MAFFEWLIHETGIYSLYCSGNRDVYLILITRFLRMFAYGGAALVLAIFLYTTGNKGQQIGTFMSLTLLGDAAISYALTLVADRVGRRRVLLIGSLLMVLAGTVFAFSKNYYVLLVAAIIGVISPGAHEIGPFRAVEESVVAHLTTIDVRTDIYAWFAVVSMLGMSGGLCIAGWTTYLLRTHFNWEWKTTYPVIFGIYAIIGLIKACLTLLLTQACEIGFQPVPPSSAEIQGDILETTEQTTLLNTPSSRRRSSTAKKPTRTARQRLTPNVTLPTRISRPSRSILFRLSFLFAINSFAGGMLPVTLMSWYASWRYRWFLTHRIGYVMAVVWLISSISNLLSASVARRLGLVRAMVLTHLPTAIFLAFIPLASTWYALLILLIAASALGSLDQAPRSAFVAAVFQPEERTAIMGALNLVKTIAAAGGPLLTGYVHDKLGGKTWWPVFVIAAILRVIYDLGLLFMFLRTPLPEESAKPHEVTVISEVDVGILLGERMLLPIPEEFERPLDDDVDDEEGYYFANGDSQHIEHANGDTRGRFAPGEVMYTA